MMHLVVALVFLVSACDRSESPSVATLDIAGFERVVIARLRTSYPSDTVERTDILTLRVRRGPSEATLNLEHAYRAYEETPADLEAILEQYTKRSPIDVLSASVAIDASKIIPIVRSRAYFEDTARFEFNPAKPSASPLAHEPLNDELVVLYVVRQDGCARLLHDDEIARAKIPPAELRDHAMKNLLAMFPSFKILKSKGILEVQVDGTHEASILVSQRLWTTATLPVEGEIVVAVPAGDIVWIAGSKDAAAIAKLRKDAAEVAATAPHPVSAHLFVRRDAKWVRFD